MLTHLIRKVIRVEEHLHIARLTDEGLRLFRLAAEHAWLAAIGYVGFGIAINNLQQGQQQQQRGEHNNKRKNDNNNNKWNFAMWRMAKSNQMISEDDSRHINRGNWENGIGRRDVLAIKLSASAYVGITQIHMSSFRRRRVIN